MRKWVFIICSLFIAACGSKSGDNNNTAAATTTATTPLNTSCISGATNCNNTVYNSYYGWQAYPGNVSPYYSGGLYRFCSCPIGTIPVYNGGMGLGCVNSSFVPYNAYQWNLGWGYSWSFTLGFRQPLPLQTGNNMINFGQVSNTQGYPGNNCYSGVAQACYVDQANSCGNGAQCIATSGGSRLGVCSNGISSGSGYR